ncbi:helix-turn-helix domain-containing protein [Streptomyces marincola]|uniref:helix-turn-helix domain-containing protein n=1 Tax=Streptomyces marincola TaxID=2878388 RepID=UPI0021005239|nr:helix-turn-helix domain-containing protein [Streptomyces marincola]
MGVVRWTGRETKALRLAHRMTVRAFAARIGVSDRMVSKWEQRGLGVVPRQGTQAALDTLLSVAGTEIQERFATLITEQAASGDDPRTETLLAADVRQYRRHPRGRQADGAGRGGHLSLRLGQRGPVAPHVLDRRLPHHERRLRPVRPGRRRGAAPASVSRIHTASTSRARCISPSDSFFARSIRSTWWATSGRAEANAAGSLVRASDSSSLPGRSTPPAPGVVTFEDHIGDGDALGGKVDASGHDCRVERDPLGIVGGGETVAVTAQHDGHRLSGVTLAQTE